MKFTHLLLFLLGLTLASCKFKILAPDNIRTQFDSGLGIPYQLTRFSKVPYGTNIIGSLLLSEPDDACSVPFERDAYSPLKDIQVPILLVKKDGCKLNIKTKNAQLAGAKMLVIIGDSNELPATPIGLDQGGLETMIPTIVLKKDDGEKLELALRTLQQTLSVEKKDASYVKASMTFPAGPITQKVTLDFWFSTADSTETVYKFLKEFKHFYVQSKDLFEFNPHYVTWYCDHCKQDHFSKETANCLSGGLYCAPDPDFQGPLNGSNVVYEDLRQICIVKKAKDFWWDYIVGFGEKCVNQANQEECVQKLLKNIGMPDDKISSVDKCMVNSFNKRGSTLNIMLDDNELLQEERYLQDEYDISMFPSLYINNQLYQESIANGQKVFKDACESLINPSQLCKRYMNDNFVIAKLDTGTIVFFMIIMLLIVIVILFFYRRMARREMTKEMSIQVSQMVSQYFAINEVRDGGHI